MKQKQELHLSMIQSKVRKLINTKYRRGAREHQGNLSNLSSKKLIDEALNEVIDLAVYLITLKNKL